MMRINLIKQQMIKRYLPIIVFAFCLAQSSWMSVNGQPGPLEAISGKFVKYCRSVPREEIYIHTDRNVYIAGEDMWFKAYLTDRQTGVSSSSSQLVYFEILNPDNHLVVSKRIELENGCGPGHIILPDSLSPGNYMLRAYTNWMKNFLPSNCFIKEIGIYNALSNRSFRINESASGSDEANPSLNRSATSEGILSMKIFSGDPDNIQITIFADDKYISVNGIMCYIFIQTHGNINYTGSVRLSGDSTIAYVPRRELIPGINHITLFNASGIPAYEKYLYTPQNKNKELLVSIKENPGVREQVEIEISGQEGLDFTTGMLSISVSPLADSAFSSDIADYMIFGSEFGTLPGNIAKRSKDEIPRAEMDEFLSTLKSSWIDWNVILNEQSPYFRYQHEKENHFIYGKMSNAETLNQVAGEYIFMSKPGKIAAFQYARTDKNGLFSFELPLSGELQDIVIQPENLSSELKIILESPFSMGFIHAGNSRAVSVKEVPEYVSEWSVNYQVRKIYGISSSGDPVSTVKPLPAFSRFYGKPDIELKMDDYIKLPVMTEVFFELVPGVYLKEKKSAWEFSIFDLTENRLNSKPPGLFIDGVVIGDAASIAGLDPELVEKIDVIKVPYLVGRYIFYGLINVITRKGDFSCVSLPGYAVRMPMRVTDPVPSFISPDYSTIEKKKNPVPDFRTTLFWEPLPVAGSDGKISAEFWTSDYSSEFLVNIQGFNKNGEPVSFRKIIEAGKKIAY